MGDARCLLYIIMVFFPPFPLSVICVVIYLFVGGDGVLVVYGCSVVVLFLCCCWFKKKNSLVSGAEGGGGIKSIKNMSIPVSMTELQVSTCCRVDICC